MDAMLLHSKLHSTSDLAASLAGIASRQKWQPASTVKRKVPEAGRLSVARDVVAGSSSWTWQVGGTYHLCTVYALL